MTIGLSPKIVADLVTTIIGWCLAHYAIQLDPEISAAIGKVAGFIAAYFAPPGAVVPPHASSSDELLKQTGQHALIPDHND